ncbi:hypothetical protein [Bradyrhizobium sp. WD16]|uniref:hypothetical protein n=1 Tax=Bradyrhizobium sp. WD16 TaxID=1521768 RepID=UPI0020A5B67E|nr:hypothetical protein [Bradyrhizobium sp. WD16]UTD28523.1 hypothetical protein DB459_18080 [Bradyrhizobium sp. WD16]
MATAEPGLNLHRPLPDGTCCWGIAILSDDRGADGRKYSALRRRMVLASYARQQPDIGMGSPVARRGDFDADQLFPIQRVQTDTMFDVVRMCRARALACEQNARSAMDPALRKEWEELAIQWHLMANVAARVSGEHADLLAD